MLRVVVAAVAAFALSGWAAAVAPDGGGAAVTATSASDVPEDKPSPIGVGDFNRDGIPDIAEATTPGDEDSGRYILRVRLGQVNGTFRDGPSLALAGGRPEALVVGDFNRDGNLDVIVGSAGGAMLEFLGDGKGNLRANGNVAELGRIASVAVGHFTHDGNLDLVVSDFGSNSAVILLGSGSGSFQRAWSFQLPRRGRAFHIATADFNKDGITDLIVASDEDDDYEVMLGNGNGTFTYAPQLSRVRDPNSYCPS